MDSTKQNNGSKITIIILAVLIAALAFFAYQNYQKNKKSEEALLEEKLQIQADLDSKIVELEKAIADNTTMESELTEAKNNIIAFRDSVKDLKTLNYKIIRRYKNKLAVLEATNNKLLKLSDSLKVANFNLSVEVDSANANIDRQAEIIQKQAYKNDSLSAQNNNLTDKVTKGAALKISNVKAIAMRERNNGQLKETNKASRTDAFRTSFKIRENVIAEPGTRKAHIVIQNAAGKVIGGVESFTDVTGQEIQFTDVTDVDYENQDIEVIAVTNVPNNSIVKGDYYIKVYLENKLLGTTKVNLK
jgi:hypothetical protein